jgi:predicted GIY-YIG superfamily endonuclease
VWDVAISPRVDKACNQEQKEKYANRQQKERLHETRGGHDERNAKNKPFP